MEKITRVSLFLVVALSLAACSKATRPPGPVPSLPPPAADMSGATVYEVNPQASELHILVLRGGTLARLGHNHVVSSKSLTGKAWIHPSFERSGFELSFPVNELIIDDPQSRREAGSDFPPEIPAADKEGTRTNMLRPEVLDAERYPMVTLRSVRVAGALESPTITARLTIRDVSRELQIPARTRLEGGRLIATGAFDVLQTDYGIKPFSVALGALEVQDRLHIKFRIVAEPTAEQRATAKSLLRLLIGLRHVMPESVRVVSARDDSDDICHSTFRD